MRVSSASAEDRNSGAGGGGPDVGYRDAESLFRTNPIPEIRNVEATTNKQIHSKKEELRLLVGNRYRDLIDSADSIVSMKSSCKSISANISSIHHRICSLSASPVSDTPNSSSPNPTRVKIYGIACRVKYLVDTPENIWGCLDESMFLEAAARYIRAKHVQHSLMKANETGVPDTKVLSYFPLLQHQCQIVESFKAQISQRSHERLMDQGLKVGAYADALAAASVIDDLEPKQVLLLFLDTRKSWIMQKLGTFAIDASGSVVAVFCEVLRIIQVSVGQVGELFLRVLNDMPLFYKVILGSPPASQLFGGIPKPDEEVRLWKQFREKLESVMVMLDKEYIGKTCLTWLRDCGKKLMSEVDGRFLVDTIASGQELASIEKLIRETMDSKEVLEGSLEWLKSVFGSVIEMPWSRIRELILEDDSDLWDEIFEDAFSKRMKKIIDMGFEDLTRVVNLTESLGAIAEVSREQIDDRVFLGRSSTCGGIWFIDPKNSDGASTLKSQLEKNDFRSCFNAYYGPEVSRLRDAVDNRCKTLLEDLLNFLDSPKASQRLKILAPHLQDKCYQSLSAILADIKKELDSYSVAIEGGRTEVHNLFPSKVVERSLFIGKLLFSFRNHLKPILVLLGSPRFWAKKTASASFNKLPSTPKLTIDTDSLTTDSLRRHNSISRKQTSFANAALLVANEGENRKLEELSRTMRDLCIKSHDFWISWLCNEMSVTLQGDLGQDDGLLATAPLSGWEETVVKQQDSDENQSEMTISLPSMPSLYVISFLFRACEEINKIGGHVLDKSILQRFAERLLEKVISIYDNFLSTRESRGSRVSEKGVLQLLLDLRFAADILSGGDGISNDDIFKTPVTKFPFRRKQDQNPMKSVMGEQIVGLINQLSQKLDPIDWLTYEPYLWENEKQSYVRHAVLFGFFVQLNRMYTDTVQKLPTNSESNIMRCSTVPRFKYLPISAPALSLKTTKTSIPESSDTISSWKAYSNGNLSPKIDLDDNTNFGVAAPFLKSFMQVGSRFGESTLKLGSILTDGQVGILKDRSAAAMSTFGDILPAQAAGLLSSFTANRSDS